MTASGSSKLCKLLCDAESSSLALAVKQADNVVVLQSLFPKLYGPLKQPLKSVLRRVSEEQPVKGDNNNVTGAPIVAVMLSGGAGSTAALWHALRVCDRPVLYHVEGLWEKSLEMVRRDCVKRLVVESRTREGGRLIDAGGRTLLRSLTAPADVRKLSRPSRLCLLASMVTEDLVSRGCKRAVLVWGNVQDCLPSLECVQPHGMRHGVPFSDATHSLFCLAEAENISEAIWESHCPQGSEASPTCILPKSISCSVCSCWSESSKSFRSRKKVEEDALKKIYAPFPAMCSACSGCSRYMKSWSQICREMPGLSLTCSTVSDSHDHRHWGNLDSFREEKKTKRLFTAYLGERKEVQQTSKRGKKKGLVKKVAEPEEEEEEEQDDPTLVKTSKDDEEEEEEPEEEDAEGLVDGFDIDELIDEADNAASDEEEGNFDVDFGSGSDGETEGSRKKRKIA